MPRLLDEKPCAEAVGLASLAASITPDIPLPLKTAVKLAFPDGSMTASGLRREAAKGRLVIERIAGKDYTTLANIERMRELCRVEPRARVSGLSQKSAMQRESSFVAQVGSSATDRARSARAALEKTARERKGRSPSTSALSTKCAETAAVIPLKSSS
jgi:hypothetical protein